MSKTLSMLGLTAGGMLLLSIVDPPSIAHQTLTTAGDVEIMAHFDPNDSPYAGKPTKTWLMMMRRSGAMISPSSCACRLSAYDSRNRPIARNLPLSTMPVEGHQKGHEAILTTITFPKPGAYTVVLTGQAKDQSFAAFELKVPVTVRP